MWSKGKTGKKLTAILLCAAMALGMSACGGNTQNTGGTEESSIVETEVTEAAEDTESAATESTEEQSGELEKIGLNVTDDASETGNPRPFRVLGVDEMVAEMGTGWNLGNTMDGHSGFTPNETLWQNDETTQALIDAVHDLGFNTVRIPVTWGTMINDEDYSINEKWISRVQDIVDYCIRQDMYVIINIHHDGADQSGWLRVGTDDLPALYEKF